MCVSVTCLLSSVLVVNYAVLWIQKGGVCSSHGNCYVLGYELLLWFSVFKPCIKGRVGWFLKLRIIYDVDSLYE